MAQDKLQKLELTWIGKDEEREAIEPRILIEDPKYSYGDTESGNMLIHGDNLLALKALEQEYSGKVKCIYIDPPYNTGSAFEHYVWNFCGVFCQTMEVCGLILMIMKFTIAKSCVMKFLEGTISFVIFHGKRDIHRLQIQKSSVIFMIIFLYIEKLTYLKETYYP